jgi:predicted double-glycine peptidase
MTIIKNFPEYRQVYEYDCGASALQSVLVYYGLDIREGKIMTMAKTTKKEGTTPQHLLAVAKKLGFKAEIICPLSLMDLKKYLQNGQPVIIDLQAWANKQKNYSRDWNNGHYVVAIGYDSKKIYFEDPNSMSRTYLSHQELLVRWHDIDADGKKYYNLGIVISGKKRSQIKIVHMD